MQTLENEAEIINLAQQGSKEAFGKIVRLYMKRAYFSALSIVGNHDDALEMSQEAFIRAYRSIKKFDTNKKFFTWYYKILRNLCLNYLRDKSNRAVNFSDLMEEADKINDTNLNPHEHSERSEIRKAVWDALWKLQPEEREIIAAKDLLDTSYEEIAELLQVPIGTVMSRLYYARKKLRKLLEGHNE